MLSLQVFDQTYFDVRCLHPKNLIEFSLGISVTERLLMILADGQIPFLFHLEG